MRDNSSTRDRASEIPARQPLLLIRLPVNLTFLAGGLAFTVITRRLPARALAMKSASVPPSSRPPEPID
jgi:hypothetical protein